MSDDLRRDVLRGMLRNVVRGARDDWFTIVVFAAATALAFWKGGAIAGTGWAAATMLWVFAAWLQVECREGWDEATRLLAPQFQRIDEELGVELTGILVCTCGADRAKAAWNAAVETTRTVLRGRGYVMLAGDLKDLLK
jgi:hypothetical protein